MVQGVRKARAQSPVKAAAKTEEQETKEDEPTVTFSAEKPAASQVEETAQKTPLEAECDHEPSESCLKQQKKACFFRENDPCQQKTTIEWSSLMDAPQDAKWDTEFRHNFVKE